MLGLFVVLLNFHCTVGADNFGGGDITFPIGTKRNGVPLLYRAFKDNGRKFGAIPECTITDTRHGLGNRYACKRVARRECPFTDACY